MVPCYLHPSEQLPTQVEDPLSAVAKRWWTEWGEALLFEEPRLCGRKRRLGTWILGETGLVDRIRSVPSHIEVLMSHMWVTFLTQLFRMHR